ncbi:MAG: hypothetical protein JO139_06340 [Alphaproteobacteria bacterium]|nr:hypothetical protein [Alphaproteobacteria bacterium]
MACGLLRKLVFLCVLVGIAALVFQAGDISSKTGDYIADRLQELERTF